MLITSSSNMGLICICQSHRPHHMFPMSPLLKEQSTSSCYVSSWNLATSSTRWHIKRNIDVIVIVTMTGCVQSMHGALLETFITGGVDIIGFGARKQTTG